MKNPTWSKRGVQGLLFICLLLTACTPAPGPHPQPGRVLVFECTGDIEFVADIRPETTWLFLPGQTIALPHVPAGSGARYSNDAITFWSQGEEALLDVPDGRTYDCSINRARSVWEEAKLRGVDFRAVGNEPGWFMDLDRERIRLVTDDGQRRQDFPTPAARTDQQLRQSRYTTDADGHHLQVILEGKSCLDSMSGEEFATQVQVELDDQILHGCGRALH